ncbi:MAG: UDP-3-O-(3-hydroxymyristoyl)glucosamine N-acyltransferase [Candidatus Wenzhouxiangella sp. M2_3B_020]
MNAEDPLPRPPVSLDRIARWLGGEIVGDRDTRIDGVSPLGEAGPGRISFLANPAYRGRLASTDASAVILSPAAVDDCPVAALVVEDPYVAWARLLERWFPPADPVPGIHASAVVADDAEIDAGAQVGPNAVVGARARIGSGAVVGPGCIVGEDVELGDGARLVGRVHVAGGARLGKRVLVHPGAVIGADGFGLAMVDGAWRKVPQIGSVRIGDDCEIGANTTIDRGALGDTVLGRDVRLDNQVQVAHNVHIGDHTAIAGCTGIAGSTRIGRYCMIAGASGIGGHLEICDRVVITAMSTVVDSILEPGSYGSGIPARPMRTWQRTLVRLAQLDRLFRRIRSPKSKS